MGCYNIPPQDWVRQIVTRDGVDTNKVFGIRYIGSAASGIVTITATTNNFTFAHGVLSSEAVDGTVGTAGEMDLTDFPSIITFLNEVNSSPNWEAWAVDLPGDFLLNFGSNTGVFLESSPWDAAVQAKVAGGIFPLFDTSKMVKEEFGAGITYNGPSSEPHGFDANVLHEILQIDANITLGDTDGLYIYECNDVLGTKTEVAHYPLVTATATTFGNGIEPLISAKGRRLVVIVKDGTGAITSPILEIIVRSYAFGPGIRKSKLYSQY